MVGDDVVGELVGLLLGEFVGLLRWPDSADGLDGVVVGGMATAIVVPLWSA